MSRERDSTTATDPAETDTCPTCTACGLHCAVTVVNAHLPQQPPSPTRNDIAQSILGLLPPEQRTAALLAALRTEATQRSAKRNTPS